MPAEKFISEAENRFVREKVDHTLKTVRNACRQPIPLSSYRSVAPIYAPIYFSIFALNPIFTAVIRCYLRLRSNFKGVLGVSASRGLLLRLTFRDEDFEFILEITLSSVSLSILK